MLFRDGEYCGALTNGEKCLEICEGKRAVDWPFISTGTEMESRHSGLKNGFRSSQSSELIREELSLLLLRAKVMASKFWRVSSICSAKFMKSPVNLFKEIAVRR